jgi:FixJ family two-component response regulator
LIVTNELKHLSKVYLVDDEADVRSTLARALSKRGYQVEAFETANDFLAA